MAKGAAAASHGLPLEQSITIINNSGKLISTGKQLVSIWKHAQFSYKEKKAELKQERTMQRAQIQRSQTDPTQSISRHHRDDNFDDDKRSRRTYDEQSVASSRRSHKTSHSRHTKQLASRNQLALTVGNLKTLSEASSTTPSKLPAAYQSPYAETTPVGAPSRADLNHAERRIMAPTERTRPTMIPRTRSEPELALQQEDTDKETDMHLAYGDMPPDLAERTDLDPKNERDKAEELVHKIENLLDEAHCAQHSANAIIKHLQEKPDAAAAVALALAELSAFVGKLSPGFLTLLKGGSPAVFALLASPQFLIATGIAVGVTVVMFGGWKIVQRVAKAHMAKGTLPFEGMPTPLVQPTAAYDNEVDEALVLKEMDEELSTIETWRRGIVSEESADLELITPKADRTIRERHAVRDPKDPMDDIDSRSRRSSRTHKSSKSHKPHKSKHVKDCSDKKSRRVDDAASVASSSLSKKSSSSRKKELKATDDERNVKSEELPSRTRPRVQHNMLKALFK